MMDEQKTINWNSVVTNAVSALVTTVFVGAAFIVWNAATTIDTRIETATNNIKLNQGQLLETQNKLQASQKTMTDEIVSLHTEIKKLRSQLNSHDEVLRNKEVGKTVSKNKPLILPKYKVSEPELVEFQKKDAERIFNKYERNRFEIQQQMRQ